MTAFKKKGLDRKTNHQDLTKVETKKLAQRPPLWRNKLRIEGESVDADEKNTDGNNGPDEVFDRGESMFWLAPSDVEHEGTIQECVMYCMLHFGNLERVGTVQKRIPG